jgi:hypothetical protein
MFLEQYIGELIVAAVTSAGTWVLTRHRQKVDTKRIEVDVLQKAIQVLNADVVTPLQHRLELSEDRYDKISTKLTKLQNAVSKRYSCRYLPVCPVCIELRNQEKRDRKDGRRKPSANRQREPDDPKDGDTCPDSLIEGDPALEL